LRDHCIRYWRESVCTINDSIKTRHQKKSQIQRPIIQKTCTSLKLQGLILRKEKSFKEGRARANGIGGKRTSEESPCKASWETEQVKKSNRSREREGGAGKIEEGGVRRKMTAEEVC